MQQLFGQMSAEASDSQQKFLLDLLQDLHESDVRTGQLNQHDRY